MPFTHVLCLIYILNVYCSLGKCEGGCKFSLTNDVPKPTPIIFSENGSKILYPNSTGFINLRANEKFRLSCSGTKFRKRQFKRDELLAACYEGKLVRIDNRLTSIGDLQCLQYPQSVSRVVGTGCYANNAETTSLKIEIGFKITVTKNSRSSRFITLYSVCFDNTTKISRYSMYDKSMLAAGYQVNKDRGSFRLDYYRDPIDIVESYYWQNERRTLSKILNSSQLANAYVDQSKFLSRGHLTPRADFVYGFEQAATMYYVNVAPQWQQFNGGNWELLESAVRNYLRNLVNGQEYRVVTGVHGQATLPDVVNRTKNLYLYRDDAKNLTLLTVPKYYWKILYHKTTGRGIGFIGLNNPYSDDITKSDKICRDICYNLNWITFDVTDIKKGYIVCCDVDELLNYIDIPDDLFQKI